MKMNIIHFGPLAILALSVVGCMDIDNPSFDELALDTTDTGAMPATSEDTDLPAESESTDLDGGWTSEPCESSNMFEIGDGEDAQTVSFCQADCGGGQSVSCSATMCSAINRNCAAGIRGSVTCNGVTTNCPQTCVGGGNLPLCSLSGVSLNCDGNGEEYHCYASVTTNCPQSAYRFEWSVAGGAQLFWPSGNYAEVWLNPQTCSLPTVSVRVYRNSNNTLLGSDWEALECMPE